MSRISRIFALLALVLSFAAEVSAHTIITRVSDRRTVTLAELSSVAGASDVVFLGESHDNKDHHDLQLELIRSLLASHPKLAIGLEMIESTYQPQLDDWVAGKIPESVMQEVFERSWTDWELYREIFVFARDSRTPMVALNVPSQIVKKVAQQGFASLTPEERKGLPEGTSCDLRNPQIAMLKRLFQGHAEHMRDGKVFNNFCEAQTVRNSGMAVKIAAYLKTHPGHKMVTLTGIWHAEKHAIPDQLERTGRKVSYTVILPETPELSTENSSTSEADYLVVL